MNHDSQPELDQDQLMEFKRQEEEAQEMLNSAYQEAAANLKEMMEDPGIQKTAYMILVGHRLIHWALHELTEQPGFTVEMVDIVMQAQREEAAKPFNFISMIHDFRTKQLKWLQTKQKVLQ